MKRLLYMLTATIAILSGCSDSGIDGIEDNFDKTLLNGKDISGVWASISKTNESDWIDVDYWVWEIHIIDGETIEHYEPSSNNLFGFKDGYLYKCSLEDFECTESVTFNLIGEKGYINGKYAGDLELLEDGNILMSGDDAVYKVKGFKDYEQNIPSSGTKDSTGLPIPLDYEIYYRTSDNQPLSCSLDSVFSHTFNEAGGYGRIVCVEPISYIGAYDFCNQMALVDINLPESVEGIGEFAFCGCQNLECITIPRETQSIGNSAFAGCSSLSVVYCKPMTPPHIGEKIFSNTHSELKIYVPFEVVSMYKGDYYDWNEYKSRIYGFDFENGSAEPNPDVSSGEVIYYDNFDGVIAQKDGTYWPYMGAEYGNPTPSYQSKVSYSAWNVTVRTNSASDSSYSDYADKASGGNNLFFGKVENYISINAISLSELVGNALTLTFGAEKYTQSGDSTFSNGEFVVYISGDGYKWSKINYSFPTNANIKGRWNLATAEFSLTEVPEYLYLYFSAGVASVYRLDDVKLTSGGNGEEINLAYGCSL